MSTPQISAPAASALLQSNPDLTSIRHIRSTHHSEPSPDPPPDNADANQSRPIHRNLYPEDPISPTLAQPQDLDRVAAGPTPIHAAVGYFSA